MKKQDFIEIMEQINITKEDRQQILNNCVLKKRVKNKLFIYSKQIAAALIIGVISLTSITTYAAVNAYQEYMSKMCEEEINERYNEIQLSSKNADSFSRPLTDLERQRLESLMVEYRNGLRFPEQSMERVDGIEVNDIKIDADKKDKPFYDFVNAVFYIPSRELTDEELLQIIDVWEKANYSLSKIEDRNNSTSEEMADEELLNQAKEFMEQYKQDVELSDEDKIKVFVEKIINSGTMSGESEDISMADYECNISLYGEHNPKYWITAENEAEKYSIFFTTDSTPDNLTVYNYHHTIKNGLSTDEQSDYSAEEIRLAIEEASIAMPAFFSEYLGIDYTIVREEIYRDVYLVLTDNMGNRYRIAMNPISGKISELVTYEAGAYDDIDLSGEVLR